MIYTREEFEKRLMQLKRKKRWETMPIQRGVITLKEQLVILGANGYCEAIDEVLNLIADEGGCFRG